VAFRWRYLNAAGAGVGGPGAGLSEEFDDQQQAEDWFAVVWAELRDQGVDAVTLLDEGVEVYGPMSLHEA
jgi:hypothetical protein